MKGRCEDRSKIKNTKRWSKKAQTNINIKKSFSLLKTFRGSYARIFFPRLSRFFPFSHSRSLCHSPLLPLSPYLNLFFFPNFACCRRDVIIAIVFNLIVLLCFFPHLVYCKRRTLCRARARICMLISISFCIQHFFLLVFVGGVFLFHRFFCLLLTSRLNLFSQYFFTSTLLSDYDDCFSLFSFFLFLSGCAINLMLLSNHRL